MKTLDSFSVMNTREARRGEAATSRNEAAVAAAGQRRDAPAANRREINQVDHQRPSVRQSTARRQSSSTEYCSATVDH